MFSHSFLQGLLFSHTIGNLPFIFYASHETVFILSELPTHKIIRGYAIDESINSSSISYDMFKYYLDLRREPNHFYPLVGSKNVISCSFKPKITSL